MSVRGAVMTLLLAAPGCTAIASPPELAECAVDEDCGALGEARGYGDCPAYSCREGRCVRRGTLLPDDALLVEVDTLELGPRQLGRMSQPIDDGTFDLVLTASERGPLAERLAVERAGFGEPSPIVVWTNPFVMQSLAGELVQGCYPETGSVPVPPCAPVALGPWIHVDSGRRARPVPPEDPLTLRGVESSSARTVGFRGIATHAPYVRSVGGAWLEGEVAVVALSTSESSSASRCPTRASQLEIVSLHTVHVAAESALTTSGGGSSELVEATAGEAAAVVVASPSRASALVLYGSAAGELVALEVTPPGGVSTDPTSSTPRLFPEHVREVARIRDDRPVGDLIVAELEGSGLSQLLLAWTPPCPDARAPLHGRLLTLEREGGLLRSVRAGEELELASAIETSEQLTVDAALPFALTALADGSAFLLAWREGPTPGVTLRLAVVTALGDVRPMPPLTPTEQPLPRGLALRATASGRTSILLEGNDAEGTNQLWLGELCEVEPR